ncbi:unnamed protein product, partial [Ectocarpus sp. 6 AP-2014]
TEKYFLLWFLGGDLSVLHCSRPRFLQTPAPRADTLSFDGSRQHVRVIAAHLFVSLVI